MSKLLIADDETSIRDFCYDLFTRDGHQVVTAARGDQALALIAQEKPDMAIIDLQIPGETKLSLLHKIREKFPRLPVVLFSGYVDATTEKEAFAAGAVEILQKGVLDASGLKNKIRKILDAKERILGASPPATPEATSEKILIVDDESAIRGFLVDFFKRKGFQTLEAKNGQEAVDMTRKEKPSVILMDITMPGMDGVLALKKIREFDKEVGVVMATSIQDEQIAKETTALGAYHYVLKPFDLQYLELVVLTRLTIAS